MPKPPVMATLLFLKLHTAYICACLCSDCNLFIVGKPELSFSSLKSLTGLPSLKTRRDSNDWTIRDMERSNLRFLGSVIGGRALWDAGLNASIVCFHFYIP